MKSPTDLNDYHRKQSVRLARKISAQPLLSPEESMKQIERLSGKSQQHKANAH